MRSRIVLLALAALVSLTSCGNGGYDERESMQYRIDHTRGRTWRLGLAGVFVRERDSAREILVELPGWIVANEPDGCLPALALGPKGEAVVTSNAIATLWRIDPGTLAVTVHSLELSSDRDKDVGFSDLTFSPAYGAYFAVSSALGSVWKIDGSLSRAERMTLPEQPIAREERRGACAIN